MNTESREQEKTLQYPEIILVNNKIYQRRSIAPFYDYVEMYVDPRDKTLKSYSYITSLKHDFRDEIKEGKTKALNYQEASKLVQGKTDANGYIWIPEMHDSPATTPPEVRSLKSKAELAHDLGRGLVSTFEALNIDQNLKDAINNLLVDQNFNLVLDSGESLTSFIFKGKTLENRQTGIQEITQFEVQGKTLIITLKNIEKLVFTPPKG